MDACIDPSLAACLVAAGPLEKAKFVVSVLGLVSLIGIVAALISMRVTVCNQIYGRWQALLFQFAGTEGAHRFLRQNRDVADQPGRSPAHFIAVAYLNLFEETFRHLESRLLVFRRVLPGPFWRSIENSMRKPFDRFLYLRTYWHAEKSSFSPDFNAYVRRRVCRVVAP